MNVYRKLPDGAWGIMMTERGQPGQTVSVQLRSGLSKNVTLGEFIYSTAVNFVFAIAAPAPRESVPVGDLSGILALFDRAKRHLKFPTIALAVSGIDGGIRISVAGDRAKVPGSLTITGQNRNAENRRDWFGRILRDGSYTATDGTTPALVDRLRAFAADPVAVASEQGRLTGHCCFCNRTLDDERSTAVGYGSTCAKNFGLAWGSRPATFAEGVTPQHVAA